MYELLSGVPPFAKFQWNWRNHPVLACCSAGVSEPEMPRSVIRVVERLMQVNPSTRYQTPGEVLLDLQPIILELDELSKGESKRRLVPPTLLHALTRGSSCASRIGQNARICCEITSRRRLSRVVLRRFSRAIQRIPQLKPDCLIVIGGTRSREDSTVFSEVQRAVIPLDNNHPRFSSF